MIARELGVPLDVVLGSPPRDRHILWPRFLREHPASLGETRIIWAIGRFAAMVYNGWRGSGARALDARDFVEGLVPLPPVSSSPDVPTGTYWERSILGIVDRLRAEHAAQVREWEASGGESDG